MPTLRQRLTSGKRVFGAWTSFAHPSITEIFATAPFDFIGIDLEHSTISQEQSQRIIAAAQAAGRACLPRIASHSMQEIKQLLDSGADGIIVPMVNSRAETDQLASWIKYPPVGNRSYGVARGQGYGYDFASYTKNWNERSVFIAQIESIQGVEAIDEILAHPELDAVMVGPYDLSGSLGIPGQIDHPLVQEASARVLAACKKHKKACGTHVIHPTPENVEEAFGRGFTFTLLGSDLFVLWKWAERMGEIMQGQRTASKETAATRS